VPVWLAQNNQAVKNTMIQLGVKKKLVTKYTHLTNYLYQCYHLNVNRFSSHIWTGDDKKIIFIGCNLHKEIMLGSPT
jgi:hypothetical protein